MKLPPIDYADISPGVRDLVRELREIHGLNTTDSGDGSHHDNGMYCAIADRHVFIQLPVAEMIECTEFLADKYPDAKVECSWSPGEEAFVLLWPDGDGVNAE